MNDPMQVALIIALGLILLAIATAYWQLRGLKMLAARQHVPSDERSFLRARYRRRLLTAVILSAIGLLIGGAYLSGLENKVDALGEPRAAPDEPKPEMTDEQKQTLRFWGGYWTLIMVLVVILVGLAFSDALASRRYWLAQYRALKEDHEAKLRRDLAVYKQHKEQNRGGKFGNRLGDPEDT